MTDATDECVCLASAMVAAVVVIHGVPLYLFTRVHGAVLAALWFPEGTTTWDQTLTPWLKE
jgi:hypothetical protein